MHQCYVTKIAAKHISLFFFCFVFFSVCLLLLHFSCFFFNSPTVHLKYSWIRSTSFVFLFVQITADIAQHTHTKKKKKKKKKNVVCSLYCFIKTERSKSIKEAYEFLPYSCFCTGWSGSLIVLFFSYLFFVFFCCCCCCCLFLSFFCRFNVYT